jgi:hypothetical protein
MKNNTPIWLKTAPAKSIIPSGEFTALMVPLLPRGTPVSAPTLPVFRAEKSGNIFFPPRNGKT